MEKKRKQQLFLILAVIFLTLYNILPTLFYYAKPVQSPVSEREAMKEAALIQSRVENLDKDTAEWLASYCKLLNIKPIRISSSPENIGHFTIDVTKSEEASLLKQFLPRAGALISFVPAQLSVQENENPKSVVVQRRLDLSMQNALAYVPKHQNGDFSKEYLSMLQTRASAIVEALMAPSKQLGSDPLLALAAQIVEVQKIHEKHPAFAKRLASHFSHSIDPSRLNELFVERKDQDKKEGIEKNELLFATAEQFIKKHPGLFVKTSKVSGPDLSKHHPYFCELQVDAEKGRIHLQLQPDLQGIEDQLLIDEVAKVAALTNEKVIQTETGYDIPLHELEDTSGLLVLKLDEVAKKFSENLVSFLRNEWHPTHPDLQNLTLVTEAQYAALSSQDQKLCLVVSTPAAGSSNISSSFQNDSIYVVVRGINHLLKTYEETSESELAQLFIQNFRSLAEILNGFGFIGYPGTHAQELGQDFIFEKPKFFSPLLAATREDFKVLGSKKNAFLELSTIQQRILTTNKIETQIHEDLVKWKDEYLASKVNMNPALRFDTPEPTQNIFWNNVKLTFKKMVRGDERKILRWGLDLSGGKTVQIELRDQNNHVVTEESAIKQGINELFNRVNKMGVSDVSIRQMGNHIVLDFPGSQSLSASELVKASSMMFHVVNEKFNTWNSSLANEVNRFLQEVWNEAVVSNHRSPEDMEAIAYRHLTDETPSDSARILRDNGLRLKDPKAPTIGKDPNLCKVALFRAAEHQEWHGQTTPLLIVFQDSALEGANLDHIRANYDPSKGNFLSFEIERGVPQNTLHSWTSQFSKENIAGSEKSEMSQGRGWRMAVLLNDRIISAPTLESALKDHCSISGSFSQREVNQLASDLKAGSLTFTPHILSEKNITPELGKTERAKGIGASVVALILVIGSMIVYYRFAGLIASLAVLFNLLILWAVLQNLGASLSLAGIAGIILTVGMAVDANVLVYERMKEEFAHSGNIGSAIRAGYSKAFSAILDSNVTTIIASLILLNFDAGPIKAFAITMIIGIASSMFTALFMTRFYFEGWLKNPRHTSLKMAHWIRSSHFDFLKWSKGTVAAAALIIVAGLTLLVSHRSTIFGMDFTGGYALSIETEGNPNTESIAEAFLKRNVADTDFHVRKLQSNQFEILLSLSLEQTGKPFFGLPLEEGKKNPRIDWVVNALQNSGIHLAGSASQSLEKNWTVMSGQMSESMRNNACIALLLAFLSIFIYISFRFEYKYAIAALLCLLHDVLITLGLVGIFYALNIPILIDLNTIAALMTIIGYSLNDTIIIFDRIREDVHLHPSRSMRQTIVRSLNATLSRTAITSGTTLLVVLALLFFGGAPVFSFSFVMVIGVIFGTLSSWFIATPLLLFFHTKEEREEKLA